MMPKQHKNPVALKFKTNSTEENATKMKVYKFSVADFSRGGGDRKVGEKH